MKRRRHNPKRNVRNTLIGAAIGAGVNVILKNWSPSSLYVYSGEQALVDPSLESTTPTGIAIDPRSRSMQLLNLLASGAVLGGIAGLAYSGATK